MSQYINHQTLIELVASGAVRHVEVVGGSQGWQVQTRYGMSVKTLVTQRGQARAFKSLEALVKYLQGVGVVRFEVNATGA